MRYFRMRSDDAGQSYMHTFYESNAEAGTYTDYGQRIACARVRVTHSRHARMIYNFYWNDVRHVGNIRQINNDWAAPCMRRIPQAKLMTSNCIAANVMVGGMNMFDCIGHLTVIAAETSRCRNSIEATDIFTHIKQLAQLATLCDHNMTHMHAPLLSRTHRSNGMKHSAVCNAIHSWRFLSNCKIIGNEWFYCRSSQRDTFCIRFLAFHTHTRTHNKFKHKKIDENVDRMEKLRRNTYKHLQATECKVQKLKKGQQIEISKIYG